MSDAEIKEAVYWAGVRADDLALGIIADLRAANARIAAMEKVCEAASRWYIRECASSIRRADVMDLYKAVAEWRKAGAA